MLRTTIISRIKKVWTITFVPRLLRGDQRCVPGKFDLFSCAVQGKAAKSTTSADENNSDKKTEQNEGADYIVKCKEEPLVEDTTAKEHANPGDETAKEIVNPLIPSRMLPKEMPEKCQRIIDKAFGKTDTIEDMLAEHYFSHSVNIEETRRKINESEQERIKLKHEKPISDNRTQFGVFKMSREPVTDKLSVGLDNSEAKVTTEKEGAKIAKREDLNLVQEKFNVQLTAGREPDFSSKLNSLPACVDDPLPPQVTSGDKDVDKYVHDQEKLENKAIYDLQEDDKSLVEDITLSQIVKDERRDDFQNAVLLGDNKHEMSLDRNFKATDTPETDHGHVDINAKNQEKINNVLDDFITHAQRDTILQATTASEKEEQLTQKVEHIDETPLVEAHKPKIEGFNVSPRVLGDAEALFGCFTQKQRDDFNSSKSANMDIQADLDEVAKRCLDSPIGKVDEILLNELDRIGIPITENQARSPVIEDNLVQMDEARVKPKDATDEQKNTVSNEIKSAIEFSSAEKLLYPSHIMKTERIFPEQVKEIESIVLESVPDIFSEEEKHGKHPNQVFIYPYHRQALSYHTKNYTPPEETKSFMKSAYYFIPTALRMDKQENINEARSNRSEVMLGKAKSPTNSKMMEIEQLEAELEEQPTVITTGQNPFYSRRLNATNISNDQQTDRYRQKTYDNETDEPAYDAKVNAPNRVWNQQYYQQNSDHRYPQRMYAKGLDRQSSYYQSMANEWNYQRSQQGLDKYAQKTNVQKSYAKEDETSPQYYEMNASNRTWNNQSYPSQYNNMYGAGAHLDPYYMRNMSSGYMWENKQTYPDPTTRQMYDNYYRGTDEASKLRAQGSTEEGQTDMKQTNSPYLTQANDQYTECSNFCVPDDGWDRKTLLQNSFNTTFNKMTTPLSFNKTNLNVSDGIWDENIEHDEITPKRNKKSKVSLPDELLNQQLDPYYVLTCNETCSISPKAVVGHHCDTSRIINATETIFEDDIKKPETHKQGSGILCDFDRKKQPALNTYIQTFSELPPANVTANLAEAVSLPNITENLALSELLKRVRERNRIMECRNELKTLGVEVEPAHGKCDRKAPRCPPTAPRSPPNNPVPPPTFGLPALKRRPDACKPRKPRTRKCSTCDLGISGVHLGPTINTHMIEVGPEMVCEMNDAGVGACTLRSKADLTEEIIDRLQSLGRMLGNLIHQGKTQLFDVGCLLRNQGVTKAMLARDFEPWSPIPSWPEPKKEGKRKSDPCAPGCPIYPPPRVCSHPDPDCNQKPCTGFPKKSFSMIDCFAVSLGDHKVYDLGEF